MSSTSRWNLVHARHGIASLRHTHWLDDEPRAYDDAPGRWWAEGGTVRGAAIPGIDDVRLEPFDAIEVGPLRLRAFRRDDALALRVYDPQNPSRLALTGIESFDEDAAWRLAGRFEPAHAGEERLVRSVDGYERAQAATGTVALTIDGTAVRLVVSGDESGLSAVIADATTADGAYPFRFLPIAAPDVDGTVIVDFNDAYLPPCAFSDQYVCPLPPPENRFAVAVRAGERRALRA